MLYKCCRILRIRLLQAFLLMVLKSFDSCMLQGLPCYICSWQCAFVHKYGINYSSTQHSEEGKGNSRSINQSIFNRSRFDFPFWMSFLFSRWKCHTLHRSPCPLSPSHAPPAWKEANACRPAHTTPEKTDHFTLTHYLNCNSYMFTWSKQNTNRRL